MRFATLVYTPRDWELGIGFTIPVTSKEFRGGMRRHIPFGVTVYVGPFTIDFRRDIRVVAFRCAGCGYEHSGAPAFEA